MITNKNDSHKWLQTKVIVTNDYKFSNHVIEVIRSVLNVLFFFTKRFYKYKKAQNRLQRTKNKNYAQKTSKKKKVTYSLICVLGFCLVAFCAFSAFSAFSV